MKHSQKGFALLVAVIFMTVMLTLGLSLGSLAYKQQVLASSAIESQSAFYAADTALECALYFDQQNNAFAFSLSPNGPTLSCGGASALSTSTLQNGSMPSQPWIIRELRIPIGTGGSSCADVTIYKYPPGTTPSTYIFAQGYDVSCSTVDSPSGVRLTARGLKVHY